MSGHCNDDGPAISLSGIMKSGSYFRPHLPFNEAQSFKYVLSLFRRKEFEELRIWPGAVNIVGRCVVWKITQVLWIRHQKVENFPRSYQSHCYLDSNHYLPILHTSEQLLAIEINGGRGHHSWLRKLNKRSRRQGLRSRTHDIRL